MKVFEREERDASRGRGRRRGCEGCASIAIVLPVGHWTVPQSCYTGSSDGCDMDSWSLRGREGSL